MKRYEPIRGSGGNIIRVDCYWNDEVFECLTEENWRLALIHDRLEELLAAVKALDLTS